jgi:hypothetical protein
MKLILIGIIIAILLAVWGSNNISTREYSPMAMEERWK